MGGFLAREYGALKDDMPTACFVEGLGYGGHTSVSLQASEVRRMYIGAQDPRTGLCTYYGGNLFHVHVFLPCVLCWMYRSFDAEREG